VSDGGALLRSKDNIATAKDTAAMLALLNPGAIGAKANVCDRPDE